jgi:flavin-binding protein dodecin
MAESVYKVIELVGTSSTSWEKAVSAAVKMASQSLRDLRIAEVSDLDVHIVDGKIVAYRAKVKVSFKYTPGGSDSSAATETPARRAKAAKAPEAEAAPAPAKKAARRRGKRS